MRKFIRIYCNWRIDVLFIIFAAMFVLLISESDNIAILIGTKIAGLVTALLFVKLYRYWGGKGKIKELDELCKD